MSAADDIAEFLVSRRARITPEQAVDEIVPPGTNLNDADGGWQSPALEAAARRR